MASWPSDLGLHIITPSSFVMPLYGIPSSSASASYSSIRFAPHSARSRYLEAHDSFCPTCPHAESRRNIQICQGQINKNWIKVFKIYFDVQFVVCFYSLCALSCGWFKPCAIGATQVAERSTSNCSGKLPSPKCIKWMCSHLKCKAEARTVYWIQNSQ